MVDGEIPDENRTNYIQSHLEQVLRAKQNCPKLGGYFVWSLTDNFEWSEGLKQRFGLIHIDYGSQKRTMKQSGKWYRDFLTTPEN